jgi:adenine-specific DNA-methyltransferase
MATLARANRLMVIGNTLRYIRFLDDFPVFPYNNVWTDTGTSGFSDKKTYVVQTNASIAERCLLMTTDPGDLVLDPTCGSGTTAFVAEKWGRRWITCDTSRVAVTLAKQRLLTASYDYYELKYPHEGLKGGFIYKTVPHVTLKSIANNPEIDEIYERMHPAIERALAELNAALQSPSPPAPLPPAGEGKTAEASLPSAEKGETAEASLPSAAERGTAPPSMGKGETALPPTGEWRTTPLPVGEGRTAKASLAPRGEGSESASPAGGRAVASAVTETAGRKVWNESTSLPSPAGGRGAGGEGAEWDYIPHPPARLPEDLKRHARAMRRTATDAENLMWRLLRNRRLANAKFRRQHPIGEYIADFYCDEHGLVVELDGGQHAEQKTYDERRTAFLQSQGLTVLRFWNHQVLDETEAVLQVIWEHVARNDTLTPSPSPAYGRGENESPSPAGGGGENESPSPGGGRGENESPSPAGGRRVWDEGVSNPPATGDSLAPTPLPPTGEGLKEWEVPFDFPPGWPASARAPFDAFHAARQAMQRQMDASIAAHADQETLYDQPLVSKTKLRITGPFTVEAVPFPTVLALEPSPQPLFQGERDVGFVADTAVARSGETSRQARWRDELLKTGIRGKGGQILKLADLEPLPGARYIHAVGTVAEESFPSPQPLSRLRERGFDRVAVSFGPEHAALEQRQVEIAMREAGELFPLPKMLVFCAFTFDPEAAKDIDNIKGITALKVQMNTDLLTEDLKKARASNESFWLMGQPDVEVRRIPSPQPSPGGRGSDWYQVEVHGFDYFDTVTGELKSGGKKQIALWLLDTDYDNRSLFPRQVFFPMAGAKDGWYKLKKDIRAELDEDLLEQFHGTVSLPFEAGENRCIAVKIVDDRGIESLKVMALD